MAGRASARISAICGPLRFPDVNTANFVIRYTANEIYNRFALIVPATDVLVAGNRNPAISPDKFKPLFIRDFFVIAGKCVENCCDRFAQVTKRLRDNVAPNVPVSKENDAFRRRFARALRSGALPGSPAHWFRNPAQVLQAIRPPATADR